MATMMIDGGLVNVKNKPNVMPLVVVRRRWYHGLFRRKTGLKLCTITMTVNIGCDKKGNTFILGD